MVRETVAAALNAETGLACIGEAADGAAGLELIRAQEPHVAVINLGMPGLTGLELLGQAREASPQTRFVLLTGAPLDSTERAGLAPLCEAFLHKEECIEVLIDAVCGAAASPTRPAPLGRSVDRDEAGLMGSDMLTEREREVLGEIGRGRSVETIARRLGCSPATVRKHCQNML